MNLLNMRLTSLFRFVVNTTTNTFSNMNRTFSVTNQPSGSASVHSDSVLILSLVLPSRQETCRFHLNLQTATVGQLIDEIKQEDAGIEQVHICDENGHLLSQSYFIDALMHSSFTIQLNKQRTFLFDSFNKLQVKEGARKHAKSDGASTEDIVAALYHALNIMQLYHSKSFELKAEANELSTQLETLEKVKNQLADISQRYTSRCIWYGLAAMSFQVGILAELTWDVYSWDIVEPITYFLAYGTAVAFYAVHLMTRTDFEYLTTTDRLFLRRFYREARRRSFDISLYNRLKDRLFIVHTDLARLRAPLSLALPAPPNPLKCKISGEEISPLDVYRANQRVEL